MATIRTRYLKKGKNGKKVEEGKQGKPSYFVEIRKKGYKPVRETFDKYSKATDFVTKVENAMNEGTWKERTKTIADNSLAERIETVEQLIDYFKENVAPEHYGNRAYMYNCMYDWWKDKIGYIKVRNLSALDIEECKQILKNEDILKKDGKKAKRKTSTINKYILCLSATLTYARNKLELIDINPCSRLTISKKGKPRERYLSVDEIEKLQKACLEHSEMIYIFFMILLSTGARYGEVLTLQVRNINFDNEWITYEKTKNDESRSVGIDTRLLARIRQYLNDRDITDEYSYIFLNKNKTKLAYIRGALNQIIKDCKIPDFHIHDIRHTTASHIAMDGGSLLDIAKILGHKSTKVTERYSHLTQKHTDTIIKSVTNKMVKYI